MAGSDDLGGSAGKNSVVSAVCHINKLTAFWVPVWNAITFSGYENVTKLEQSIEISNEQNALLQSFETQIYLKLLPMIRNIESDLIELQQGLQNQSHLHFDMAALV